MYLNPKTRKNTQDQTKFGLRYYRMCVYSLRYYFNVSVTLPFISYKLTTIFQ